MTVNEIVDFVTPFWTGIRDLVDRTSSSNIRAAVVRSLRIEPQPLDPLFFCDSQGYWSVSQNVAITRRADDPRRSNRNRKPRSAASTSAHQAEDAPSSTSTYSRVRRTSARGRARDVHQAELQTDDDHTKSSISPSHSHSAASPPLSPSAAASVHGRPSPPSSSASAPAEQKIYTVPLTSLQRLISKVIIAGGGAMLVDEINQAIPSSWKNKRRDKDIDPDFKRSILASLSKNVHSQPVFQREPKTKRWQLGQYNPLRYFDDSSDDAEQVPAASSSSSRSSSSSNESAATEKEAQQSSGDNRDCRDDDSELATTSTTTTTTTTITTTTTARKQRGGNSNSRKRATPTPATTEEHEEAEEEVNDDAAALEFSSTVVRLIQRCLLEDEKGPLQLHFDAIVAFVADGLAHASFSKRPRTELSLAIRNALRLSSRDDGSPLFFIVPQHFDHWSLVPFQLSASAFQQLSESELLAVRAIARHGGKCRLDQLQADESTWLKISECLSQPNSPLQLQTDDEASPRDDVTSTDFCVIADRLREDESPSQITIRKVGPIPIPYSRRRRDHPESS